MFNELITLFGKRCIHDDEQSLKKYSHDMVMDERQWMMPSAVVFPINADEVISLMIWANRNKVAVTPRGAGTGLAGGAIASQGGVVCSFEQMNRIVEIDLENMMVTVEPGVITNSLDKELEPLGLFFAGYPMSEETCHIGGNVAENAGGGRSIKYGVSGNYVIAADIVSPTGELLKLGGKYLKNATGYNLLPLFIGSEGTLGLFTQITLRVFARPQVRSTILVSFSSSQKAARVVTKLKIGSAPSAIEFMDGETARRTQKQIPSSRGVSLPENAEAILLVEYDGNSQEIVSAQINAGCSILGNTKGIILDIGREPESIERVWALRKAIPWWTKQEGGQFISLEDVVVPPSSVPVLVEFTEDLRREFNIAIALFGHAGDGNLHITPMKNKAMSIEMWRWVEKELLEKLYEKVISLGGTISGEHGIGRKRTAYIHTALSSPTIAAMRSIKRILDPENVLNPGVILPDDRAGVMVQDVYK